MEDTHQMPVTGKRGKSNGRGIPLLRSCERCRRRKQRCDGDQPACGRCLGQKAECKYRQSGRFRKRHPQRTSALEAATTLSGMSVAMGSGMTTTSAIMFQVPELSPASAFSHTDTLSPCTMMNTPMTAGLIIDPVEILKTRELPDLTQGLPDAILQRMWALVGSGGSGVQGDGSVELAPDLGLLDPHNAQTPRAYQVPAALVSVAQRYGLPHAERLLSMLRESFVDSGMKIRTRQFWATLEAGRIGDFALLAHLAIAVREANLTQAGQPELESACYAAARREWDCGRVEASTSAVFALLLLSEYGYQTGRPLVMGEYADHALATARRIEFRGACYPWRSSSTLQGACDVEREHVLACFWSAWVRAFTAAQVLGRCVPVPGEGEGPEFPTHDLCHYTAQPVATGLGTVAFSPMPCRHTPQGAYSRATWQCALLGAEMHNHGVAALAGHQSRASYFAALREWDRQLRAWRDAWPAEWPAQMARLARLAQRVPHDEPLALDAEWLADLGSGSVAGTPRLLPPTPDTRPVGAHLFHESRVSAADAWLAVVFVMHDTTRLRAHRVALDLGSPGDPLEAAISEHTSRGQTLDAARGVQNVLGCVQRLGFPPARMGVWVVFVLEQAIDVISAWLFRSDDAVLQGDALQRLAALVRHLLALKQWTAALYVFASLVKRHVGAEWVLGLDAARRVPAGDTAGSPWPATHVLTLLMRALRLDARQFCAYTMPAVYASACTKEMSLGLRMRIASLLS